MKPRLCQYRPHFVLPEGPARGPRCERFATHRVFWNCEPTQERIENGDYMLTCSTHAAGSTRFTGRPLRIGAPIPPTGGEGEK